MRAPSKAKKRERIAQIVESLEGIYPDAVCALEYGGEPWRLLVMGRLSAQCTDARVNIVCRELLGLAEKVSAPVPEERTPEYYKKRPCPDIIADAADILEEYLKEQGKLKKVADK